MLILLWVFLFYLLLFNHFKVSKTVITEVLDTVRIKDNSFYSESIGTRIEETLKLSISSANLLK